MTRLFPILICLCLAAPALAGEISRGDWTGSDDCRQGKGDCFAQTLHVDDDFGGYRLVIRFVIGQFIGSGNFQAGFEAALMPKPDSPEAVVRKIVFHSGGLPKSFKTHQQQTTGDGLVYTESFSLFKNGDPALADLVAHLKKAAVLETTLVIESEGALATRETAISLKGSSHVLREAFGTIDRKPPDYDAPVTFDLLSGFPTGQIKACMKLSGPALSAESMGNFDCQDLAEMEVGDTAIVYKPSPAEDAVIFERLGPKLFRTIQNNLGCDIVLDDAPAVAFENSRAFFVRVAEHCGGLALVLAFPKPGGEAVDVDDVLLGAEAFRTLTSRLYGDEAEAARALFR